MHQRARLEHAIDRMDAELEDQRRRCADAKARLAGYAPRLGETFPLQGELDDKLAQLFDIEAELASTEGAAGETIRHSRRPSPPEQYSPFGRSLPCPPTPSPAAFSRDRDPPGAGAKME
jgi:hypothetical protein